MKRKPQIQFKALLLLLIYAFSNNPYLVFHHHHSETVSIGNHATCNPVKCGIVETGRGSHSTHVSIATVKCPLCDNHTVFAHALQADSYPGLIQGWSLRNFNIEGTYAFQILLGISNKGPPQISA